MNGLKDSNSPSLNSWLIQQLNFQEVEEKLMAMGYDDDSVKTYLNEYKKLKYAKRQNIGFKLVAIGALLGFVSCVLTMINPVPQLCDLFLYGFTSIAIVFVLLGFYYIFE